MHNLDVDSLFTNNPLDATIFTKTYCHNYHNITTIIINY